MLTACLHCFAGEHSSTSHSTSITSTSHISQSGTYVAVQIFSSIIMPIIPTCYHVMTRPFPSPSPSPSRPPSRLPPHHLDPRAVRSPDSRRRPERNDNDRIPTFKFPEAFPCPIPTSPDHPNTYNLRTL